MSTHRTIAPRGLKPEQAAEYTGLSVSTLWRMAQTGRVKRLEGVRVVVYDRRSLDALFEDKADKTEPIDPIAAKIAAL